MAASSRESALPRFQQRPPNGAQEGVVVGDVAVAEWSAGVANKAVDGVLTSTPWSLSIYIYIYIYTLIENRVGDDGMPAIL